jgi:hypothetical protein
MVVDVFHLKLCVLCFSGSILTHRIDAVVIGKWFSNCAPQHFNSRATGNLSPGVHYTAVIQFQDTVLLLSYFYLLILNVQFKSFFFLWRMSAIAFHAMVCFC